MKKLPLEIPNIKESDCSFAHCGTQTGVLFRAQTFLCMSFIQLHFEFAYIVVITRDISSIKKQAFCIYHLLISKICFWSFRASNPLQGVSDLRPSKFLH